MFGCDRAFDVHSATLVWRRSTRRCWARGGVGATHHRQGMSAHLMGEEEMERNIRPAAVDPVLALETGIDGDPRTSGYAPLARSGSAWGGGWPAGIGKEFDRRRLGVADDIAQARAACRGIRYGRVGLPW